MLRLYAAAVLCELNPQPVAICTLDVLPICCITLLFLFVDGFVGFSNTFLHFFAALQQTILLRVNNCNNLGLIDARCNAEVSPLAVRGWRRAEQQSGAGFCASFGHVK